MCTSCKNETTQTYIFDVIGHVISHIFITCKMIKFNHQSCNCGNLPHVYGVSQCHLIMGIIICKSSVSVLLSLLIFHQFSLLYMINMIFFEICNSVKMLKNYTHMKVYSACNIFCDMRYFSDNCSNHCHLQYCGQVFITCLCFSVDLHMLYICVQN